MNCEMCGKETELYTASIEGATMKVCPNCAGHGKVLQRPKPVPKKTKRKIAAPVPAEPAVEVVAAVVDDYAKLIKDARSKTGMTQKDFAKKINEKESLLHKMETGGFKPSIPLAKKLEIGLDDIIVAEPGPALASHGGPKLLGVIAIPANPSANC